MTVPSLYGDNLSSVNMSSNPVLHARTKHIEIDLYIVRDKVLQHQIMVHHIPYHLQIVDCLTKRLSSSRFQLLRDKLSVVSSTSLDH